MDDSHTEAIAQLKSAVLFLGERVEALAVSEMSLTIAIKHLVNRWPGDPSKDPELTQLLDLADSLSLYSPMTDEQRQKVTNRLQMMLRRSQ